MSTLRRADAELPADAPAGGQPSRRPAAAVPGVVAADGWAARLPGPAVARPDVALVHDPGAVPEQTVVSWPVAVPSAEQVAAACVELAAMPLGREGVRHHRAKMEQFRLLKVMVGKTRPAPPLVRAQERAAALGWTQTAATAAARALVQLRLARAGMPACLELDGGGYCGPELATPAGVLLGTSFGLQRGSHQSVTDCLENSYAALRPQRGVRLPWMHWVGAYGRPVPPAALAYDGMALMAGMALDPEHHAWALFGHATHWHLVACRVRDDGRTLAIPEPGLSLRTTVDGLDAESGFRSAYDMPGPPRGRLVGPISTGRLCAQLRGRDAAGELTIEEVALQGPEWAMRISRLGAPPPRVSGLLMLAKPSYRHVAGIIRHCMDGDE